MSTDSRPIKRHPSIKPFSRDHHFGLLLCWKIREGFRKGIEPERMKKYTDWFYTQYLQPHFDAEERNLFCILPPDHKLIKRAWAEHRKIRRLFEDNSDIRRSLTLIEEELEAHIRFEERILFNEVQKVATEEQLQKVEEFHQDPVLDEWEDEFWK